MNVASRTRLAYGRVLVVEDGPAALRSLERIVAKFRPVKHALTYQGGLAELNSRTDWCGFVFDVRLDEVVEGGILLLEQAVRDFPGVPAAIATGFLTPSIVNRAAALGAVVLSKPFGDAELMPFLQHVISRELGFEKDFSDRLDSVSRALKLSPREHEILAWFVAGSDREGYLALTGMAETTFKTHVKHMLAKTTCPGLAELVSHVLRRVVVPGAETRTLSAVRKKASPEG